ncbi:MAG: hypothetical protein ABJN34_14895 [Litoreibacter sp.]|uniref:hypothetical protein n=1 Tax=Litoreibacter sp. TaxID=1969459 RepID=UPI0032973CA3
MIDIESHAPFWAEVKLLLSPTDLFKAAKLSGMPIDEDQITHRWEHMQSNPALCLEMGEAAAHALHLLLAQIDFEDVFDNPSPFIILDSF